MTVRMSDYEESTWTASGRYFSAGKWEGQNGSYRESMYRHPLGLVEVYESIGNRGFTSLRFLHQGKEHVRRWNTSWGDKTLARLARELIEDVVGGASS